MLASPTMNFPHALQTAALATASLAMLSCDQPAPESAAPPAHETPAAEAPAAETAEIQLFNGETLDGWSHVLVDKSLKKEDVWSVQDGILVCKGQPLGYLHTNASYQDYRLSFEWRWAPGTEPSNSGALLRIAAEPESFLPKCVEAQLQHGKAGDLYGFYGANINGDADRYKEIDSAKIGKFKAVSRLKGMEKPAGEWNRYDITVEGDRIEVHINGELVNRASGLDVLAGPIGLQSEGSEIHFRNITLKPVK